MYSCPNTVVYVRTLSKRLTHRQAAEPVADEDLIAVVGCVCAHLFDHDNLFRRGILMVTELEASRGKAGERASL